jgi:hypothetical protein
MAAHPMTERLSSTLSLIFPTYQMTQSYLASDLKRVIWKHISLLVFLPLGIIGYETSDNHPLETGGIEFSSYGPRDSLRDDISRLNLRNQKLHLRAAA